MWKYLYFIEKARIDVYYDRLGLMCWENENRKESSFDEHASYLERLLKHFKISDINLPAGVKDYDWEGLSTKLKKREIPDIIFEIIELEYIYWYQKEPYYLARLAKSYGAINQKKLYQEMVLNGLKFDLYNPSLLLALGKYHREEGDPKKAIELYDRACSKAIYDGRFKMYSIIKIAKGAALLDLYEKSFEDSILNDAVKTINEANFYKPDHPFVHRVRGRIKKLIGMNGDIDFERALDLEKEFRSRDSKGSLIISLQKNQRMHEDKYDLL